MRVEMDRLFSAFDFNKPRFEVVKSFPQIEQKRSRTEAFKETAAGVLWVGAGAYLIYKGVTSEDWVSGVMFFGIGVAAIYRGQKLIRHKEQRYVQDQGVGQNKLAA